MNQVIRASLLFVLIIFLSACPNTQVPATDVSGMWSGLLGDLASDTSKIEFGAEIEQQGSTLTGTGRYGPTTLGVSGALSGKVDGSTITFSFSFLADSAGNKATYTFTGEVLGDSTSGTVTAQTENSPGEITGQFEMTRATE